VRFPDHINKIFGYIEGSAGIGLALGPFLGALLYEVDGYYFPFLIIGILFTLNTILVIFKLPDI
jgi:MFS family permease